MVTFKSFNTIVLEMLQYLKLSQPNLDTKPNSVARDLFIDSQALQISSIYEELRKISALQSINNVTGQDLTNYASNFGVQRKTGTKAIGSILVTFRSIDTDFSIPAGSVVRTRQGIPFATVSNISVNTTQSNAYRATATRYREQLDIVGISDEFALELSVEAQSSGSSGNIAQYSIISHSIPSVNNVTNVVSFSGGTDVETDETFRARILATFAGSNIGTSLGYKSIILQLPSALDALVVEPGDPLMIRDGTVTSTDSDGNTIVSEPGTGGRVDIYVLGENLQSGTDSFVYADKSGRNDPTDSNNDYILGQSSSTSSTTLSLNSRRVETLSEGAEIPKQPVSSLVSVSGSLSGPNFTEQYTDSTGNFQGNYKLTKDSGYAGGSPFGLDKFVWTSDRINLINESAIKGTYNSIDALAFTDVLKIPSAKQDVQVTNENSKISSTTKDYITTRHVPVKTVNRVFNLTTGERYTIIDQNPDGTSGDLNTTGRIKISGRTLPTTSDVLQVDYIWNHEFDQYVDFDNLNPKDNANTAQDSIEWGFSNYIRDEESVTILDSYNNLTVSTKYKISRVLSVSKYETATTTVLSNSTGKYVQTPTAVTNVYYIKDLSASGSPEVYNTTINDGNFSNLIITLPSDTIASVGDSVYVVYNINNLLDIDGYDTGVVVNNKISLQPYYITSSGTPILVNYVANFIDVLSSNNISSLPIYGDGQNSFSGLDGYQPVQNIYSGSIVTSNVRRSPAKLSVTVSNLINSGTLRVSGITINKVESTFTATADKIDFSSLIRKNEGLTTTASISSIYISKVNKLEKVTLTTSNEVKSVDVTYDLKNYELNTSKWDKANAIQNTSLSVTEMALSDVDTNTDNPITTGTILRVSFYYAKENDYDDLFFSRNGSYITNKTFGYISSIHRISGFQDASSVVNGKFSIAVFNQPADNSSYFIDYDYTAPKKNERITINYEYNKLITDSTSLIEENRPITADVLVKAAIKIELDVDVKIVVTSAFKNNSSTVKQDVADNIASALSPGSLETIIDGSDIVNSIYNVEGVDRVRLIRFNKTGVSGTKNSILSGKNEYFAPGIITVEIEDR